MSKFKRKVRAFDDEESEIQDEVEIISELRNSKIIDAASKRPSKKPLLIPLIPRQTEKSKSNRQDIFINGSNSMRKSTVDTTTQSNDKLADEALRLLLNPNQTRIAAIEPLMARNKISDSLSHMNERQLFKHDVSSRPDVATLNAYERIPIQDFGVDINKFISNL